MATVCVRGQSRRGQGAGGLLDQEGEDEAARHVGVEIGLHGPQRAEAPGGRNVSTTLIHPSSPFKLASRLSGLVD